MSKLAIVYWSNTGNTKMMAEAIKEGAKDSEVFLSEVSSFDKDINEFDAIALGCPSMGDEVLEEAEFEPFYAKIKEDLKNKKVAVFGSYGWGDGLWMRNWVSELKELGVTLVDEGLMCNYTPDEAGLEQCKALGEKLA